MTQGVISLTWGKYVSNWYRAVSWLARVFADFIPVAREDQFRPVNSSDYFRPAETTARFNYPLETIAARLLDYPELLLGSGPCQPDPLLLVRSSNFHYGNFPY